MPLTSNLKKAVDLPVWEWTRFAPVAPTAGLSCSCTADNNIINENNGRFIYYLINATNFWRYDTFADSYMQLASPANAPLTASTMRFAGALGYHNRVLSATSNTIRTGMPTGRSAVGFKIRIISGTGAGQERIITAVSDPIVADFGNATAGATTSLTDTGKNWFGSAVSADTATTGIFTGGIANVNGWAGYVIRTLPFGTGPNQVRRILYNTNQVITIGDININTYEPFSNTVWVAPAAGTLYQIESSIVTVDTPWDVVPDQSSRFVIRSGAILLLSGAAGTPFHTMQYYCVLADMWYALPAMQNMALAAPTDNSLERTTENSTIWYRGTASTGTTTTLVDSSASWNTNEWAGYEMFIFTGTGRGQIAQVTSNTSNTLTFASITGAPDSTSRYEIIGFDAGISTGGNLYNKLCDTTKSWATNRWKNFAVRILYGKGAGQIRRILSNSSTELMLYRGWNVLPDNTSVYSIQGDSETMHFTWGGSAQHFQYSTMGGVNMTHTGRSYDFGTASVLAALRCDSNHNVDDTSPIALTSLVGTSVITGTSVQPHCLKVGDWVSIRGVTGSGNENQYNLNGLFQLTSIPSTTTFTYTPVAPGTNIYTYLTPLTTNNLSDASKDYRDLVSSGTNTSLTFSRITPSNINGWYADGFNITPGVRVTGGAGTTTVYLSDNSGTATGIVRFSPWGPTTLITNTVASNSGSGMASITMTGVNNPNINGWYVTGFGIPHYTFVTRGANDTIVTLSNACTGTPTGVVGFFAPEVAGKVFFIATAAPVLTTANTTSQLAVGVSPTGAGLGFLGAAITAPTAAVSRYLVMDLPIIGANFDGSTSNYIAGIANAGSATTLIDNNSFWIGITGTATSGTTTINLSTAAPGNVNGWYITGSGILNGTRVISGASTTTLTVNTPFSGVVSGLVACCAWGPSGQTSSHLVGKRIRILAGPGAGQELAITAVTPGAGTLTFASATAAGLFSAYTIVSTPVKGAGHELAWIYGNDTITSQDRGKYMWCPRGGAVVGIDKLDITTDKIIYVHTTPFTETLGAGSFYAYDGQNKIWFTKEATQRLYYLDVNTGYVYGGGIYPYTAGTAGIGNKMEIFQTPDRLNYLWINRHANVEHFRALLYY